MEKGRPIPEKTSIFPKGDSVLRTAEDLFKFFPEGGQGPEVLPLAPGLRAPGGHFLSGRKTPSQSGGGGLF